MAETRTSVIKHSKSGLVRILFTSLMIKDDSVIRACQTFAQSYFRRTRAILSRCVLLCIKRTASLTCLVTTLYCYRILQLTDTIRYLACVTNWI